MMLAKKKFLAYNTEWDNCLKLVLKDYSTAKQNGFGI